MKRDKPEDTNFQSYANLVYRAHETLNNIKRDKYVKIDGEALDIPSVVAVSKYDSFPW